MEVLENLSREYVGEIVAPTFAEAVAEARNRMKSLGVCKVIFVYGEGVFALKKYSDENERE